MSQVQLVKSHIEKHGYITQVIALSYGVRRLASRINDLKRDGLAINSEIRKDDVGVRYAYYTLAEQSDSRLAA